MKEIPIWSLTRNISYNYLD